MAKEAKKEKVKNANSIHTVYEISGDKVTRKNKSCPKCGPGVFLSEHKDRRSCGKCSYSEKK